MALDQTADMTLMQRHKLYCDKLKAQGIKLIEFACPGCSKPIETIPAPVGETWDTLSQCPHCEAYVKKITVGPTAYALALPSSLNQ